MHTIENIYDMNQRCKKLSNEKLYELINDILYVWSILETKRVDLMETAEKVYKDYCKLYQ